MIIYSIMVSIMVVLMALEEEDRWKVEVGKWKVEGGRRKAEGVKC